MNQPLQGKTVAILAAQEFEDIELLYPLLRLSEAGAEILVSAVPMGLHPRPFLPDKPVTGRFGTPLPIPVMQPGARYSMVPIEELRSDRIDALVLPGGFSPDYLRRHAAVLDLVRECHRQGKVIASICHAPWVLISAGIVRGRQLTGVVAVRDDILNAGGEFLDQAVVRDGNLISSRKPDDLPEFCLEIIAALCPVAV